MRALVLSSSSVAVSGAIALMQSIITLCNLMGARLYPNPVKVEEDARQIVVLDVRLVEVP